MIAISRTSTRFAQASVTYIAFVLVAAPCLADTASLKAEADLALVQAQVDAARQKQMLDAVAAIKPAADGKSGITNSDASAEGLVVARAALRATASQLAATVKSMLPQGKSRILIVQGNQPPDVSQYLSFNALSAQLQSNIESAHLTWMTVNKLPAGKAAPDVNFLFGPLVGIAVLTAIAPLFKSDIVIDGSKLTLADSELRALITRSLSSISDVVVDTDDLLISQMPSAVESFRHSMDDSYKAAANDLNVYRRKVADKGGEAKIEEPLRAAGQDLETSITDYRAFMSKIYTPVGGVLPAAVIDTQFRRFQALSGKGSPAQAETILYVLAVRANMTTVTKKSLFSGFHSTPTTLRVATAIDYTLVLPKSQTAAFGVVECLTTPIKYDAISLTTAVPINICRPKPDELSQ